MPLAIVILIPREYSVAEPDLARLRMLLTRRAQSQQD
jgi:hypothetical protein